MRRSFTILVLVGAVALLQGHSIAFWVEWVGWAGVGWSLLLELVGLWLWWQPARRPLAFCASLLLTIGPIYQVSAPVLSAGRTSQAHVETLGSLQAEVTQREQALATYVQNSTARPGWLPAIQEAQAGLDRARDGVRKATFQQASAEAPWQRQAVIAMQVAAIVLFQVVAVLAITTLSRPEALPTAGKHLNAGVGEVAGSREALPETASRSRFQTAPDEKRLPDNASPRALPEAASAPQASATAERNQGSVADPLTAPKEAFEALPAHAAVAPLLARLDSVLAKTGQSQNAWGKANGFSSKQMSQVRNHERAIAAGERGAPASLIARVNVALGGNS